MKKCAIFILIIILLFTAVSCEKKHIHSYSDEWSWDEVYHWHEPLCDDASVDKQEHTFSNNKCSECGYDPSSEIEYPDSTIFATQLQAVTDDDLKGLKEKLGQIVINCDTTGLFIGDMLLKNHTVRGNNAENSQITVEGLNGGFSVTDRLKVSIETMTPLQGKTSRQFYYADKDCAIDESDKSKNYYKVGQTLSYLIDDVFEDIKSELMNAYSIIDSGKVSAASGKFELIRIENKLSAYDNATYILVLKNNGLAGFRVTRSYMEIGGAVTKQLEMLIGEYKVNKPDTTGYKQYDRRPKWAADKYTDESIFDAEYVQATTEQLAVIKQLFMNASRIIAENKAEIAASGDIRIVYESFASKNDITMNLSGAMKIHEISDIVVDDEDEEDGYRLEKIEHYADNTTCYEIYAGEVTSYKGDYTKAFYSILPDAAFQLCDFINMYLNALSDGVKDAFDVTVCDSEFDAIKLAVYDNEMYYVFNGEGKLIAAKVKMGEGESSMTLMVGKFPVTVPTFDKCTPGMGSPNIDYI